jgi:DnaJ-class molecular chaperone
MKTATLRSGLTALARDEGAYTFANRTQAEKAARRACLTTGQPWTVWRGIGRAFYVVLGDDCPHCNGYGSSLKESADRCSQCGGSGVVVKRNKGDG